MPIIRLGKSDAFERFLNERRGGSQLSTPKAVVVVLVLLLAVNGFLLYRQTTIPSASVPLSSPDAQAVDTTAASGTADNAPEEPSEPEDTASEAPATTAETSVESRTSSFSRDLGEAIRRCDGDRKECMQEFVAEVAPEAKYIGGRTDLNIGGSGRNKEILYFEDPNLGTCEHTRQEYMASDRIATVVIFGQGSFDEGRAECVPET